MNRRTLPVRRLRSDMRAEVARLSAGRGPFVSVYLDITPGEARRTAPERLAHGFGALPDPTRAQLELFAQGPLAVPETFDHDGTLAALIDADGQYLLTTYPQPPRLDVVTQSSLPYLAPLLNAEQATIHHVIALVHDGVLDVVTVPRHGQAVSARYTVGDDNQAAASYIERICLMSHTTLLIVAAPEADLGAIGDQLELNLPVETVAVRLSLDGLDDEQLAGELVRAAATHAANRTVELLRLWRFHHSQDEAATGVTEVCHALAQGRAALLLVHDDPADERHAWFGQAAHRLGVDMQDAAPIDSGERLVEGRLTDVVIRAALLTGCPVHIVPSVEETLTDGMGVILADQASALSLTELLEL